MTTWMAAGLATTGKWSGISTCLIHACAVQRRYPLDQWHIGMKSVPDECKAEVKAYLAIMAERTRLAERLKVLKRLQESASGKIL